MSDTSILTLTDIESRIAGALKLAGISIEVKKGELVSILGANGAGKTSLLGVIAGLYKPSVGTVRLEGSSITGLPPYRIARMGIGFAPQNHPIFNSLSVAETLELGRPNTQIDVESLFPNIATKRHMRAASLSGGERQMLSMAIALQNDPKICIFDEPSSGLAPKIVSQVFEAIKRMVEAGITVLMVEQNARAALRFADRAYVMEHGKIIASGLAADLANDDQIRRAYLGM